MSPNSILTPFNGETKNYVSNIVQRYVVDSAIDVNIQQICFLRAVFCKITVIGSTAGTLILSRYRSTYSSVGVRTDVQT